MTITSAPSDPKTAPHDLGATPRRVANALWKLAELQRTACRTVSEDRLRRQTDDCAMKLERLAQLLLATDAARPQATQDSSSLKRRGRPPKHLSTVEGTGAPYGWLVSTPADKLYRHVRAASEIPRLRQAHSWELAHTGRKTVLSLIEMRLRQLGARIGGPSAPPIANYDELGEFEILGELLTRDDVQFAADVLAWEHWAPRPRARVVKQAAELAGEAGKRAVEATSPRPPKPQEPFAGFDALAATPQQRVAVREALSQQDLCTLERTLDYEKKTRNRVIMLAAIETALRRARLVLRPQGG